MSFKSLQMLLALGLLLGCSDDNAPPLADAGPLDIAVIQDGQDLEQGLPWDSIDSACPQDGPCVLEAKGEGKHQDDVVVIGEVVRLSGRNLADVDSVWIGATLAPILSVSASEVVCQVGPKTPTGAQSIEVKAGSSRRMFPGVTVWRLVVVASKDGAALQTFDTGTRSAGRALSFPSAPLASPVLDQSGRYLVAPVSGGLALVDLAREESAQLSGVSAPVAWAIVDDQLLAADQSGVLFSADLSSFPTLQVQQVASAPSTAALLALGGSQVIGLHPSPASAEGSLWFSQDLSSFGWLQQGASPYQLAGSAELLQGQRLGQRVAALLQGNSQALVSLTLGSSTPTDLEVRQVQGAEGLALAAGGDLLALSAVNDTKLTIHDFSAAAQAPTSITLSSSAARLQAGSLPAFANTIFVLVGPPAGADPVSSSVELVDLAQAQRLDIGGKPAVELSDIRDGRGDSLQSTLHLITSSQWHTYEWSTSPFGMTEILPSQQLSLAKPRWLMIQP